MPLKIIKNILFPIDFTNYSIDLLEYVILFAQSVRSRLHLLHVITSGETPSFDELNEFFHTIRSQPPDDVTKFALDQLDLIKIHIRDRSAAEGIVRYSGENEIDMVMMAAHAPGRPVEGPVAPTVHRVLENSPCPVMVIRIPREGSKHQSRFELTLQEIKREVAARRERE
jgi:nucleotide-binding universal stress UspA family protein